MLCSLCYLLSGSDSTDRVSAEGFGPKAVSRISCSWFDTPFPLQDGSSTLFARFRVPSQIAEICPMMLSLLGCEFRSGGERKLVLSTSQGRVVSVFICSLCVIEARHVWRIFTALERFACGRRIFGSE